MSELTYKDTVNAKYHEMINQELKEMPSFVRIFMNAVAQSVSESTRYGYLLDIKTFLHFLQQNNPLCADIPLKDLDISVLEKIDPMDLDEYMAYLKSYSDPVTGLLRQNTPGSIKRKMSAISTMYAKLNKRRVVTNNPVNGIDLPKINESTIKKDFLTDDEISSLFAAIENGSTLSDTSKKIVMGHTKYRDFAIVMTLLSSGIRVSELVGLNVDDIAFDDPEADDMGNTVYAATVHRKGGRSDTVMLTEECVNVIRIYMEQERPHLMGTNDNAQQPALFLSLRKKRISVDSVQILLHKYGDPVIAHGKIMHPHLLRKTRGTRLYNATGDLYLTADVLGHKNVDVTRKHYTSIYDERKRNAAYAGQYEDSEQQKPDL